MLVSDLIFEQDALDSGLTEFRPPCVGSVSYETLLQIQPRYTRMPQSPGHFFHLIKRSPEKKGDLPLFTAEREPDYGEDDEESLVGSTG